jgi:iron complex transport system substrate-binding protein
MRNLVAFALLLQVPILAQSQSELRIITAGSAMTETVCALGDCGKIVASDKTSLYPEKIQSLPSIGYRTSINAEGIISLKPSLVIAEKAYVADAVLEQIRATGVKIVIIDRVFDFTGTKNMITTIGEVLNRSNEAKLLIGKIEAELGEAAALAKKSKSTPKVLCVYNRGTQSVDVAGTKTFASILPLVGATSAITGVDGYKPLNAEALIASNPEYILMFESGVNSLGGIDGVLKIAGVMQTTAGREKQIIAYDGIRLSNFGPRLGETVRDLVLLLHPDLQPKKQ